MFKNVIVGVDEQQGGRDATALAKDLVATDGSLMLARVLIRDALIGRGASPDFDAITRQRAHELHEAARDVMHVEAEVRCLESSSVGRGLHELATDEHADLLVIGSCRRGLVGRVMIADDTSDALNGAPCAIAIAPFGYADGPHVMGEIGVAYNGSPDSDEALAVARALAAEHAAKLSAFEAVAVPAYLSVPGAGAGATAELVPALIDQARARIAALGDVEPHAAYGVAGEELAVYSASLDLLVIGSRGYGPLGRLVHGSTSRQLAHSARCPLLVLTRSAHARPQPEPDQTDRALAPTAVG